MQPLIKITSEPIRMVRFSQNARLVSSDSIDMERRKAVARQMSMRQSAGQGGISVEDIKRINHTFSKKQASFQPAPGSPAPQQTVSRRPQPQPRPQIQAQAPVSSSMSEMTAAESAVVSEAVPTAVNMQSSASVPDITLVTSSSYTAQRGSFEMRVAKGELTYLPPMVMTIVTQRPSVHIEYLGDVNYVPPRHEIGRGVNLFT